MGPIKKKRLGLFGEKQKARKNTNGATWRMKHVLNSIRKKILLLGVSLIQSISPLTIRKFKHLHLIQWGMSQYPTVWKTHVYFLYSGRSLAMMTFFKIKLSKCRLLSDVTYSTLLQSRDGRYQLFYKSDGKIHVELGKSTQFMHCCKISLLSKQLFFENKNYDVSMKNVL